MPGDLIIGVFALGAVLLLIGLLGGNFKFGVGEINAVVRNPIIRVFALFFGIVLICIAIGSSQKLHIVIISKPPYISINPTPTPTSTSTPTPTSTPTSTSTGSENEKFFVIGMQSQFQEKLEKLARDNVGEFPDIKVCKSKNKEPLDSSEEPYYLVIGPRNSKSEAKELESKVKQSIQTDAYTKNILDIPFEC